PGSMGRPRPASQAYGGRSLTAVLRSQGAIRAQAGPPPGARRHRLAVVLPPRAREAAGWNAPVVAQALRRLPAWHRSLAPAHGGGAHRAGRRGPAAGELALHGVARDGRA